MIVQVHTATLVGMKGIRVGVEVDVNRKGFPTFSIVGEASSAIEESKERVRTAIRNSGFRFPDAKITVNLSPAHIKKKGTHFDLPLALGILAASEQIPASILHNKIIFGEVSLEGRVKHVPGMMSLGECCHDTELLLMPAANAFEGGLLQKRVQAVGIEHIRQILNSTPSGYTFPSITVQKEANNTTFANIHGMALAKRAMEIAAAGFHHIHISGPPGAGKTLLASAFPSILPEMQEDEFLEVCKITSISNGAELQTSFQAPFRSPHHTISFSGLLGGGSNLEPGEVTLAHNGVLFLDEFPEFKAQHIESLRQPLEHGSIALSRLHAKVVYPARFILIAASNPCPCGYHGTRGRECVCTAYQISQYQKKISGPIQDRIDMHIRVSSQQVPVQSMPRGEESSTIRSRVVQARSIQKKRFSNEPFRVNGLATSEHIRKYCRVSKGAENTLNEAAKKLKLSYRSYYKAIKVAQTIADLAGISQIEESHMKESLQYRHFPT